MDDLTIIYYTANVNKENFQRNTQRQLLKAVGDTSIVSVSFKPTIVGDNCRNICIGEQKRSNYMIYKQVLIGVREAKTKYVAMAEDDMLYSAEHFQHRPSDDQTFSYNINKWSIFSWINPPFLSYRVRKLMNSLITTREALLKTLTERYTKYPVLERIDPELYKMYWGEPGRFENHLGISPLKTDEYSSSVPNIMFSTSEALGYQDLGDRKAHTNIRRNRLESWGTAQEILDIYEG